MAKPRITFYGGVESVTGSNFLLEDETKILVDCGLIQGYQSGEDKNKKDFPYNPADINFLLITHAHIDHIGRIGKLVKDGFNGTIYSTRVTKDIAKYMLEDALNVMRYRNKNKKGRRDGVEATDEDKKEEALYEKEHVEKALSLWQTIEYHESKELNEFTVMPKDAGHILGSAMYEITHEPSNRKIVFTGDLGNSPTPLLRDTEKITDADYLIIESVYGDRNHEEVKERQHKLKDVLNKVIKRKGVLIIPIFSLEKTQVLLHEMNDLIEGGEVESVPVFLDSPLGIKLTSVYAKELKNYNDHIQKEIKSGDDVFDFPKLKMTLRRNESEDIDKEPSPKIIIASSGMSEGGRIMSHEKSYLSDKNNAFLLIGFQVAGSLGRRIKDGQKRVKIGNTYINVKADVFVVDGYSSHKDSDGLTDFVAKTAEKVKKVFVVMGEPKSSLFLVQKLRDLLEVDAISPGEGQSFELD